MFILMIVLYASLKAQCLVVCLTISQLYLVSKLPSDYFPITPTHHPQPRGKNKQTKYFLRLVKECNSQVCQEQQTPYFLHSPTFGCEIVILCVGGLRNANKIFTYSLFIAMLTSAFKHHFATVLAILSFIQGIYERHDDG